MYWAKKKKVIKSKVSWITTKSNRGFDKNLAKPIPY